MNAARGEYTCVRCHCKRPARFLLPSEPLQRTAGGDYAAAPGITWQCAIRYACDTQQKYRLARLLAEHDIHLGYWELPYRTAAGLLATHMKLHEVLADHPYQD